MPQLSTDDFSVKYSGNTKFLYLCITPFTYFNITEESVDENTDLSTTNNCEDEDTESLNCSDCNVNFVSRHSLNKHLLFHIKQPVVILTRLKTPSIKITLKSTSKDNFEVVSSPGSPLVSPTHSLNLEQQDQEQHEETEIAQETEEPNISFSPNCANGLESPTATSENSNSNAMNDFLEEGECPPGVQENEDEYTHVPGAEPTPPPEPAPEYPKIRIKTTGLLSRESVTITEITDDNPDGLPTRPEMIELCSKDDAAQNNGGFGSNQCDENNSWTTPSLEDPLRIPDSNEKDDGSSLLSLFGDNNERAKDLGFTSSDSEFISLDRLDDRNRGAMVSSSLYYRVWE